MTTVAFLGPAGTFSEDALLAATGEARVDDIAKATIFEAIQAVASGEVDRALDPFENSIEGSVRVTLDALAFDVEGVAIVGEHDHPIRHGLISKSGVRMEDIEVVLSHRPRRIIGPKVALDERLQGLLVALFAAHRSDRAALGGSQAIAGLTRNRVLSGVRCHLRTQSLNARPVAVVAGQTRGLLGDGTGERLH